MNLSYLEAWEIQPGIHIQVLHPSTEKLNSPGGIGKTESSLIEPHTRMGVHEDIQEWGIEEILNSVDT
ncbi:hypothetical protein DAPPUDRAFT_232943 [Daphnia pulex]|uniref:Uncharacterized protein n=1 Tax=Daphnia pulex TaxID=6669 RepID=E9FSS2_DAPPU|nr:hypothetical protein DAPPUDRAFT_232943 [Daphnia pulex]|eukprot:EFX89247.1 hypothetical protein DAPPUDRAFT_232943 [Daphnia pulex]